MCYYLEMQNMLFSHSSTSNLLPLQPKNSLDWILKNKIFRARLFLSAQPWSMNGVQSVQLEDIVPLRRSPLVYYSLASRWSTPAYFSFLYKRWFLCSAKRRKLNVFPSQWTCVVKSIVSTTEDLSNLFISTKANLLHT